MDIKKTGGPAFPGALPGAATGMTLRDYFAAQAMLMKFGKTGTAITWAEMAARCYAMADCMIAERAK